MNGLIDEETLQDVYAWIDKIPLSKPKRNIARDFSDGGNVTLLTSCLHKQNKRASKLLVLFYFTNLFITYLLHFFVVSLILLPLILRL